MISLHPGRFEVVLHLAVGAAVSALVVLFLIFPPFATLRAALGSGGPLASRSSTSASLDTDSGHNPLSTAGFRLHSSSIAVVLLRRHHVMRPHLPFHLYKRRP